MAHAGQNTVHSFFQNFPIKMPYFVHTPGVILHGPVMLSIAEEIKIIQNSSSEEERLRRMQQLQTRLREEDMQRKLRNVRLISSVERLGERAASLREYTDRLRLIKRQYEVLAAQLSEDSPADQSQSREVAAPSHGSQSELSAGETLHRQSRDNAGLTDGGGDVGAAAGGLLTGFYDPRMAARGWRDGPQQAWGRPQPDRDELGRSLQSRSALLRSRIATSLTSRPPAPGPPQDEAGARPHLGPPVDRGPAARDPASVDRGPPGAAGWDRDGTLSRDRSAPMQDRSWSEYSLSAPGRRRAAPAAWDGTLEGVASRWGSLERPPEEDRAGQLQQLDRALHRQRQLLTAADQLQRQRPDDALQTEDHREELPRRPSSWLEPDPEPRYREAQPGHEDHRPRSQERETLYQDGEPRHHGGASGRREPDPECYDHEPRHRDHRYQERGRESEHRDIARAYSDTRPTCRDRVSWRPDGEDGYPDPEPRYREPQTRHDGAQPRYQGTPHHREEREPVHQEPGERPGRRRESEARHQETERERAASRQEPGHSWGPEPPHHRPQLENQQLELRRQESDSRRQESGSRQQEADLERRESGVRRQNSESTYKEPGFRPQESESRHPEHVFSRQESGSRDQEVELDRQEPVAADRRMSVASGMSQKEGQSQPQRASGTSPSERKPSYAASVPTAGYSRSNSRQTDQSSGKQAAKKKRNMDWLLGRDASPPNGEPHVDSVAPRAAEAAGGSTGGQAAAQRSGDGAGSRTNEPASVGATGPATRGRHSPDSPTPALAPVPARAAAAASSSSESSPARGRPPPPEPALAPLKLRLDSGSESYHLSADQGGDDSDDDFWG